MARTRYKSSISISFEFVFYLTYAYDDSGNILSKKRYAYTTGDLSGLTPAETINYTYGNENWGDLLTSYNGKAITYDAIGNPLTYDGWTYTWKDGRRLATASKGTNTLSYKYNADGIRTSKTVNGTTTEYFLNGTQIIAQKTGDDIMWFYYDHDGKRIGLEYQGEMYYYAYNLQGDVKYISDANGNVCGGYTYDDYGKIISSFNSGPHTVATANPFRYRGYYYDTETELYYLNFRYYNPEWGRFLNADNYYFSSSVLGYNLFAYCLNNPINNYDPSGHLILPTIYRFTIKVAAKVVAKISSYVSKKYSNFVDSYIANNEVSLNQDEYTYAKKYPIKTYLWKTSKEKADKYTDSYYGVGAHEQDENEANAYRHAMWSAIMTYYMGEDQARLYGKMHENHDSTRDKLYYKLNDQMDLYYDELGIQVALANPNASLDELAELVKSAVEDDPSHIIRQ